MFRALTTHITAGQAARHMLASGSVEQSANRALSRATIRRAADRYATSNGGVARGDLVAYVGQILRHADRTPFSTNVDELLKPCATVLLSAQRVPERIQMCVFGLARNLVNTQISTQVAPTPVQREDNGGDGEKVAERIRCADVDEMHLSCGDLLAGTGVPATQPAASSLAAGCLYAYLANEDNCTDALNSYVPSQQPINAKLLQQVVALTPVATVQYHRNAKAVLAAAHAQPRMALTQAQRTCDHAADLKLWCEAICLLLETDPDTENDLRIGSALSFVLRALPADICIAQALAQQLAATHGLAAQYFVGAYVAQYGWSGLQRLLLEAVERKLRRVERTAADQTALAMMTLKVVSAQGPSDAMRTGAVAIAGSARQALAPIGCHAPLCPWIQRVMPMLAVKLLIQHLRPYIDHEDFKYLDLPDYQALARLLHNSLNASEEELADAAVVSSARQEVDGQAGRYCLNGMRKTAASG